MNKKKQIAKMIAAQQALQEQQALEALFDQQEQQTEKKSDSTTGFINFLLLCVLAGIGFLIFTGGK